jgi:broad specificity phosphatase PhoE
MKRIVLIRHAESTANVGCKTSMPRDIELSAFGHEQALALVSGIQDKPDLIVTSAYIRTLQTASPLINRFPDTLHEQWPIHEFTYLSPIRCQDTTTEQRIPLAMEYWNRCDPDYRDGDGAESFADFMVRVRSAKDRIKQRTERCMMLFSHHQFINAMLWIAGRASPHPITAEGMDNFRKFLFSGTIDNCQIIEYKTDWLSQ